MYAAGRVKPQPNPLNIRPIKTGTKEIWPHMMLTHPVSSQIIPKRRVHKHPMFSITEPLKKVPIMIVKDKTLTKMQKHRDRIWNLSLIPAKNQIDYYVTLHRLCFGKITKYHRCASRFSRGLI